MKNSSKYLITGYDIMVISMFCQINQLGWANCGKGKRFYWNTCRCKGVTENSPTPNNKEVKVKSPNNMSIKLQKTFWSGHNINEGSILLRCLSVTAKQEEQYQESNTEAAKWNYFFYQFKCAFTACQKVLHFWMCSLIP